MKKKNLISVLDELNTFEEPKIYLEQYATGSELGAEILLTIDEEVGFDNTFVCDLGCGCGMLMVGSALLGCSGAIGIDIDKESLEVCRQNIETMEVESLCDLVQMDVLKMKDPNQFKKKFDIIVMNPPFGTKNNAGIDMQFIQRALSMLENKGSLYSLHKTSTRHFILRKSKQWNGINAECVAELKWNLKKTYAHQKKLSLDIDVDLWRFNKK